MRDSLTTMANKYQKGSLLSSEKELSNNFSQLESTSRAQESLCLVTVKIMKWDPLSLMDIVRLSQ